MEDNTNEKVITPNHERAELILNNVGLSWDKIEGKRVLDIGSGESTLAQAGVHRDSTATISSVDVERNEEWLEFPWGNRQTPVQADAENLPFKSGSFDYAIMHGLTGFLAIPEVARVLRHGGEMRMWPMAGKMLEYWNVSYYLDKVKGLPRQEIVDLLENYDRQIEEANGWIPNEYVDLRKEALDNLTQEQKLEVVDLMAKRYSEMLGLQFSYEVKDPKAYEPNALLIYKKEV